MPKENIDRAIKKGTGELEGVDYQEVTYEGYAPGGVALIIDAVTDNPTRTVADVRHKMSRGGGNLGTPNSVSFMFEKKGILTIPVSANRDEDAMLEAALEAGAEDFRREDEESYVVTTEPASFHAVKQALEEKGIVASEAELAMVPKTIVTVSGPDVESLLKLIESIEDLDDVQKVWANFDIDDADLATL
jgi:YebC/PmpR family DNA-binding regulatory protein